MSGSDKLPSLGHFRADLRYYGHSSSLPSPGATANIPPAPHPFIAHFYPILAGNQALNSGYQPPVQPISRPSSAAALVALAASGCVGKNFSSHFLRNFQNQGLKDNFPFKDRISNEHPQQGGDLQFVNKPRQQFDVQSLAGSSSPPPGVHSASPPHSNHLVNRPGAFSFNSNHIQTAWNQLLSRFQNQDGFSETFAESFSDYSNHANSRDLKPEHFAYSRDRFPLNPEFASFFASRTPSVNMPFSNENDSSLRMMENQNVKCTETDGEKMLKKSEGRRISSDTLVKSESNAGEKIRKSKECDKLTEIGVLSRNIQADGSRKRVLRNPNSSMPLSDELTRVDCDLLNSSNSRCSSVSSDQSQDEFSLRKRRKKSTIIRDTCPVCGVTVRPSELQNHLRLEIEKLSKIGSDIQKKRDTYRRLATERRTSFSPLPTTSMSVSGKRITEISMRSDKQNRLKTFHKVRSNRLERLNSRVGHTLRVQQTVTSSESLPGFSGTTGWLPSLHWSPQTGALPSNCPVCCIRLVGTPASVHEHVGRCLRQRNVTEQLEDEDVDVENPDLPPFTNGSSNGSCHDDTPSDKSFGSEYEWCGQTRVRATSLIDRNTLTSATGYCVMKPSSPNEDRYLNVETDDSHIFGPPQFAEEDLIQPGGSSEEESKRDSTLRSSYQMDDDSALPSAGTNAVNVITSLRLKLEELENERRSLRCMICMESYKDPLTSVQCWHVHCEKCWMRALAVKKLCPQCNAITSTDKLRRIYL